MSNDEFIIRTSLFFIDIDMTLSWKPPGWAITIVCRIPRESGRFRPG